MKHKFKPGDIVISRYRARWTGIVINYGFICWLDEEGNKVETKYRNGIGHVHINDKSNGRSIRIFPCPENCCLVKLLYDSCGKPHRKTIFKIIHEDWLDEVV